MPVPSPGENVGPAAPYIESAVTALAIMYREKCTFDIGVAAILGVNDLAGAPFRQVDVSTMIGVEIPSAASCAAQGMVAAGLAKLLGWSSQRTNLYGATPHLSTVAEGYASWYAKTVFEHSTLPDTEVIQRAELMFSACAGTPGHPMEKLVPLVGREKHIAEPHIRYRAFASFAFGQGIGQAVHRTMERTIMEHPLARGHKRVKGRVSGQTSGATSAQ